MGFFDSLFGGQKSNPANQAMPYISPNSRLYIANVFALYQRRAICFTEATRPIWWVIK